MRIKDALLVEGTSNAEILCYGLFQHTDADTAYQHLQDGGARTRLLVDDGWPQSLLLSETMIDSEEKIPAAVLAVLDQMFEVGKCLAAVCLYDGAFGSFDDFLGAPVADQTYAFCFSDGEPVVNLDPSLLKSEEWAAVIAKCRGRLVRR